MDRTGEWGEALAIASKRLLDAESCRNFQEGMLMRPTLRKTAFAQAVERLHDSIRGLAAFVSENKRDYIAAAGRLTSGDKDRIEEEVGLVVKACTAQIEQLKGSVVAAAAGGQGDRGAAPLINKQTEAHLHGVVLSLVEALHSVTAGFDKCRAVRYQQAMERGAAAHRAMSHAAAGAGPGSATTRMPRSKGTKWEAPSRGAAADLDGWEGAGDGDSDGNFKLQTMEDLEARQLMEELLSTSQQVHTAERTMKEITTLNQMISTAVMHQAEQIEQIYSAAVEATGNVKRGNEDLRKTVALNRSSQLYVVVLLLTASALLLFMDWFYS